MKKMLLSGNEAIARGLYESNVWIVTGYPGTPSSEIIAAVSKDYPEINSEWSVNEKVAFEIALGASIAGVRSMVTMKHVGLNVAADPLLTAAYTGVGAGFVVMVADDPAMHSSQNEQDTRNYGNFAKVPVLEPSDSQEAKDFVKAAYEISEEFDTPVILRCMTRISHTQTGVSISEPVRVKPVKEYKKNPQKYVMVPANAKMRHHFVVERSAKLREFSESFAGNRIEWKDKKIGIVTGSIAYQYVKEVLPDASIFKVGMYPLPIDKIKDFAAKVDTLYVVEELDPIIETELKANGIEVVGKSVIPLEGELSIEAIAKAFDIILTTGTTPVEGLPPRPPALCKGCGHIQVFETLSEMGVTVLGDIGCYTLGVLPPYNAMDTTICMGASVGNEIGFKKAAMLQQKPFNSVAIIGDSTFFHSGMTGLLDAVYNQTPITLIILDNRITAMTGHQPSPNTGYNPNFESIGKVDLEQVVRGLGVKRVRKVKITAHSKDELKKTLEEEIEANEPSVIIADEICIIAEPRLKKLAEGKKEIE